MVVAKLTSKGQVTIPKKLRDRLGLRPGDELEFVEGAGELHVRKHLSTSPFEKYRGFLKHLEGQDSDELVREMRGH
ncbi:MAG: AbrB/MazE/SpoVT family DNA-binding domain-containing protein [SAR202 cluster bacterium]|jgi:AbrB family looped-hinge helix DNA binding protein|nr:AbrB family transcriptional regulator [Chloroflexota bacterium]MDP6419841.1 AbrB/MazE/SpoVT family DNA-binding domain-containing protein [SAR202 cluster bacterium]HAL48556.1 AbrB family transcriptional regulator [Dehalococcoidia bacterium]MDP6665192.1 AbrB/MazE/SpoVT family DNA-binding domain-containing protein [SAR202 cluster bacterium]MDP6800663.1 AbrB/MazE/SpoVT family DNA-binding domain-containing protein [SAR202 cluster bacterium]